jgi:hypothetical protein
MSADRLIFNTWRRQLASTFIGDLVHSRLAPTFAFR